MAQRHPGWPLGAVAWRAALLTFLWGALSDNAGWYFGMVFIIAATLISLFYAPVQRTPWSLWGLGRFLIYFLKEGLLAGFDVAYRAFHPSLPVQPILLDYPLRLPPGPGRVLFASAINLQPGTLSAEFENDTLIIHLLVESTYNRVKLTTMEERVAALFAITLVAHPFKEANHD